MKEGISMRKNRSVLNTDAFDKRRFKEIFAMSPSIQRVTRESALPMFEPLLGDIWASLYKMKPQVLGEKVDDALRVNVTLITRLMADESFINYRHATRLDDLLSAIGTVKFGWVMHRWIMEQCVENEELHNMIQDISKIEKKLQQLDWQEKLKDKKEQLESYYIEAMNEFDGKLQQVLYDNNDSFSQALAQAVEETKQVKDDLTSLFGGGIGNGEAQLKKVPLRELLLLAEKMTVEKKMKEIAEWTGRFKQGTKKKRKTVNRASIERSGIILGNDSDKLLPIELGLFTHPITRLDFLRRFVEGQTMQYDLSGRDKLAKGPIVLCLDQSGSMYNLDSEAKGFTLALLSIAKKQRRDFCLILFSTTIEVCTYRKGNMKTTELIRLAQTFLGGGTNFELPLNQALETINESRFKRADIVFVTDGEFELADSFLETFNIEKKKKAFHVLSLVIGEQTRAVKSFSDKVVQVKEFNDQGSYAAFDL